MMLNMTEKEILSILRCLSFVIHSSTENKEISINSENSDTREYYRSLYLGCAKLNDAAYGSGTEHQDICKDYLIHCCPDLQVKSDVPDENSPSIPPLDPNQLELIRKMGYRF